MILSKPGVSNKRTAKVVSMACDSLLNRHTIRGSVAERI
jgi:hypothetical protein